jgi:hypothetical protein
MIALDVLYVALATVFVMVVLHVLTFVATRVMYPPAPQIIYRNVPVQVQQQPPPPPPDIGGAATSIADLYPKNEPTLTQASQEVKLPEYEPRKSDSDSLRLDAKLPAGLQTVDPRTL